VKKDESIVPVLLEADRRGTVRFSWAEKEVKLDLKGCSDGFARHRGGDASRVSRTYIVERKGSDRRTKNIGHLRESYNRAVGAY